MPNKTLASDLAKSEFFTDIKDFVNEVLSDLKQKSQESIDDTDELQRLTSVRKGVEEIGNIANGLNTKLRELSDSSFVSLTPEERVGFLNKELAFAVVTCEKILKIDPWETRDQVLVKSLVCQIRALMIDADKENFDISNLQELLRDLNHAWSEDSPDINFYGFSIRREHPSMLWRKLADAYALLAMLPEAVKSLTEDPDQEELFLSATAVEAYLYRIFGDYDMKVGDNHQREFHTKFNEIQSLQDPRVYAPWWNISFKPSLVDIQDSAMKLPSLLNPEALNTSVEEQMSESVEVEPQVDTPVNATAVVHTSPKEESTITKRTKKTPKEKAVV